MQRADGFGRDELIKETTMIRKCLIIALAGFGGLFCASSARAQEFPGLGVGGMYEMNMQFEAQFDVWARQGAWEAALATPNDQPLPFNAMTISNSITEGSNAALSFVQNSEINSNRALDAVGRWDLGAVQGNWAFGGQFGGTPQVLPYQPGAYHDNNGWITPGFNPNFENFYPIVNP
jgi:hypothetical protein